MNYDVIIVGSGPAGVNCAYPLLQAGINVAIIDANQENLEIKSNIKIAQRFGKGGLSALWYGISDFFNKDELTDTGLPHSKILNEYKCLSKELGIEIDVSKKDFYTLPALKNYRTADIIDNYKKFQNFTYIPNQLVLNVKESKDCVEIQTTTKKFSAKYLVLCAGAINSTRIVMQSFNIEELPFMTKPNYIFICLNISSTFNKKDQLAYINKSAKKTRDRFFIQFYKPFAYKKIISKVFSSLVLADIRFPSYPSKNKYYKLGKAGFEINFDSTQEELDLQKRELNNIKKVLPSLGLIPLRFLKDRISSHYAGGLDVNLEGKLFSCKRIYVGDSASWKALPAKPHTLTIMANARVIGKEVLRNFK